MGESTVLLIIISFFACGLFCGFVAGEKNRSYFSWLVLGVLFGPMALIAIAGTPIRRVRKKTIQTVQSENVSNGSNMGASTVVAIIGIVGIILVGAIIFAKA